MKVVFVNRYFHPDHSATSQILTELAFDLAEGGYEIHVITSQQRYDDPSAGLAAREEAFGVRIYRVWTSRFGRRGLYGRAIDYATFYMTAGIKLFGLVRAGDIVVAKTDPPLISVVVAVVTRLRGAVMVNWLQDIFPEIAERLSLRVARGVALGVARWLLDYSIARATVNVVLANRMASELAKVTPCLPERIQVIHNWADGKVLAPIEPELNPLRREWGLGEQFVVGYSGNMGRVHEFETVLRAIELLRDEPSLKFLFIGGGNYSGWLKDEVARRGLEEQVLFRPYQPKSALSESLGVADVHLVVLRPELEGLVVPSKFYGIVAVGRPTIHIGDMNGEIGGQINRNHCGITVEVGDARGLADAVLKLKHDREIWSAMGANARRLFLEQFDRPRAVKQWLAVIQRR